MKIFINKNYLLQLCLLLTQQAFAQSSTTMQQLPLYTVTATNDTTRPMIVYITGDGGWNKFSKALCTNLAAKGFPVVALDAKEYFWKKKTAAQTTTDISRMIRTYQKTWNRKKIILLGYSFGADVLPFVLNRLPPDLSAQVLNLCLVSPATNTDFEIHLAVMLGAGFSGGESVLAELNKILIKPVTLIMGSDENDFPINQLKIKNYISVRLEGGHHYDGDEAKLSNTIIQHIPVK
jgi:type IV secretory pathway VirJ component